MTVSASSCMLPRSGDSSACWAALTRLSSTDTDGPGIAAGARACSSTGSSGSSAWTAIGADRPTTNKAAETKTIVRDRWIVDIAGSLLYVRGVNGAPGRDRDLRSCIDGAHRMRALPDGGRMALSWYVASILLGVWRCQTQSPRIANRW